MAKLKRVPIDARGPILSAVVANNDVAFRNIVRLYFHDDWVVWDATYGRGVFWKQVYPEFRVVRSDIARLPSIQFQADARMMPFDYGSLDAIIFDPPYLLVGGLKTLKKSIDRGYRNAKRGFVGDAEVLMLYEQTLLEAWDVLKPGGLIITKSMNQVYSGRLYPLTAYILRAAQTIGFKLIDWMVTVVKTTPTMRHTYQMHSRRNCSDWLILERRKINES